MAKSLTSAVCRVRQAPRRWRHLDPELRSTAPDKHIQGSDHGALLQQDMPQKPSFQKTWESLLYKDKPISWPR